MDGKSIVKLDLLNGYKCELPGLLFKLFVEFISREFIVIILVSDGRFWAFVIRINSFNAFKKEYLFGYGIGILEKKSFLSKNLGIDPLNKYGINGRPIGTHNGIMSYLLIGGVMLLGILICFLFYLIYAIFRIKNNFDHKCLFLFLISLSLLGFQILTGSLYPKFHWMFFGMVISLLLNNKESN